MLKNILVIIFITGLLSACANPQYAKFTTNNTPINLIPMYGYPNIEKTATQKKADEQFIKTVVADSGSREKSSKDFAAWGWAERQKGNIDNAMRRFNQAWLLDPNNFLAYWGFGAITLSNKKPGEAVVYFEKALGLIDDESQKPRLFVDAARAYALRSNIEKQATPEKSNESYNKAKILITKALDADLKYGKAYRIGALISYSHGDYRTAWEIVNRARTTGNYKFDDEFIKSLSDEMAEHK